MNYKISIIIPVYNVENYVADCLDSVYRQTYENIEVIIVNDCTPDNSIGVVNNFLAKHSEFKDKVRIVTHSTNSGLAVARNTGVKASTGDYVLHLDSDDSIDSCTVEECVACIKKNDADAVIYGMRHVFKTYSFIEHVSIPKNHTDYINSLIRRENVVCMCGGVYKRSLYVDYNIWAIPGLNMGEDYSTKPRLLYNARKVVALDKPFYNYNHTNENSYTSSFAQARITNLAKTITVLSDFFQVQEDCERYVDSLRIASLAAKVLLLKRWALSRKDLESFKMINNLYTDIPIFTINGSLNRLILFLSRCNCVLLLRMLIKIGFYTKSIIKQII